MKGQWTGQFGGYSSGSVTIEIDELSSAYSGRICVFEDSSYLVYVVEFVSAAKQQTLRYVGPLQIQRIANTTIVTTTELQQNFPKAVFPDHVDLTLKLTQKGLRVFATTYAGTTKIGSLHAFLTKGSAEKKSRIAADKKVRTWDKFKLMVGSLPPDRYIFRGQSVRNRLRTSFHRTNRRNLNRFASVDIPVIHGMVTAKTTHYFDLRDNIQNAAFWNLLQHHGYPTPLLDWTHSPYVAAYFAYREKFTVPEVDRKIRIFMFDREEWEKDYQQLYSIVNVLPHFSILNPIALENPRALPQQAICSITTVDDVESYLEKRGLSKGKKYIKVFELPYSSRTSVLTELRLMGVAAGSLFPGVDGACEEMRLKNFIS